MGPEIVGIGEILIDFVATEPVSYEEASTFIKCFGGAPMNTLVGVARLGSSAGAITAVGDDSFGRFLIMELEKNKVDATRVKVKKGTRTTITFVAREQTTGERSFIFYRKPWVRGTSDSALSIDDIDLDYASEAKILHVSGFALSQNPSRTAILATVEYARKRGVRVSFDPTLRNDVWNSEASTRRLYARILRMSDIATFSREEANFVFRTDNPEKAAEAALDCGVKIVGIKLGEKGSFVQSSDGLKLYQPAFKVKTLDTTGAGDGWNAGLLIGLLRGWDLRDCAVVANAVGALVVTKLGATTALPYKSELNRLLKSREVDLRL